MRYFPKSFFSVGFVLAYLIFGSGSTAVLSVKADARETAAAFAATLPRKIYQYSVVPGGIYTPEELADARRTDPVVAKHFEDFGPDTKVTRLKEDMWAYVSYRKGNKVYYTKKKHKVCKGELVITDGKNYARTRCANRLSKIFKPPALTYDEPKPRDLDVLDTPDYTIPTPDPTLTTSYYPFPETPAYRDVLPSTPTGANPGAKPYPPPQFELPGQFIVPQYTPLGGVVPGVLIAPAPNSPPVTPPVVVLTPEPSTLSLILVSAAGLALVIRRKTYAV